MISQDNQANQAKSENKPNNPIVENIQARNIVFDYRALRLLMGLIALSLPFVVSLIASPTLTSISASYHTEARNAFVGQLFVVAAFLWAYNGHTRRQSVFSKIAALAAVLVATCPTACDICSGTCTVCAGNKMVYVHYISAVGLFSILAYFCLGPFRVRKEDDTQKRQRRRKIYLVCGWAMLVSMAVAGILQISLTEQAVMQYRVTYWAEAVALCAFGVAWIVSGKYLKVLVDQEDALKLLPVSQK